MPHAISSRDGSSSPPTQSVPPRSPRRGRGPARGRRPSCIPSQVSGVEPKAFDSRIAISTEILVRSFTGSKSACRVPPSPWAARVTVKSASLSGRRSRQGDLSRASELQLGELGLRLVPCPMVSPSEDCGLDNFFQVWRVDQPPPPGRLAGRRRIVEGQDVYSFSGNSSDFENRGTSGHRDGSRRHGGAESVGAHEWRMPPSGCRTAIAAAGEPMRDSVPDATASVTSGGPR